MLDKEQAVYPQAHWVAFAILAISMALSLVVSLVALMLGGGFPQGVGYGLGIVPPMVAAHYLVSRHRLPLGADYRLEVSVWAVGLQVALLLLVTMGIGYLAEGHALALVPRLGPVVVTVLLLALGVATGIVYLGLWLGERTGLRVAGRLAARG